MLILALGATVPHQAPLIHRVGFVYKFFKRTTITEVESEPVSHTDIFGTSDESDSLQNN